MKGSRLLLVACVSSLGAAQVNWPPPYPPSVPIPAPPIPPPSPPAPPSNTTVSFFNVGACALVPSIKFQFPDEERSGSGGEISCPPAFRVVGSASLCQIPGPYGREVFVNLAGDVHYLDITILDAANDDAPISTPVRVYLSAQKRNHVGAVVAQSTPNDGASCVNAFELLGEFDSGDIAPGYFRTIFRHAAGGVGTAAIVANAESTVDDIAPGTSLTLDQRLLTAADLPSPVGISFATPSSGSAASVATSPGNPSMERLWGSTCEMASTAFVFFGWPAAGLPLRVLRLDGAGLDVCDLTEAETAKFDAQLAVYSTLPSEAVTVAFGVSPFLPRALLTSSAVLSYRGWASYSVRQPSELWLQVRSPFASLRIPSHPFSSLRIPSHPFSSLLRPFASLRIPSHPFASLCIPSHPFASLRIPSHPFASLLIPSASF